MGQLRRIILRLTHSSPERKACRALLAAAKKGDREQYLALASNYLDLAQAYFGNSLREAPETRLDRTGQIFTALWQHLRYAERLSDFEFMLASSLIDNSPENGPIHSENPLVTRIRLLPPRVRFAFIAYEFERWSPRWVALVMRCKPRALHRLLSEARCELCGVSWDSLCREERDCLQAVSLSFEQCPNLRANKALSKRVARYPRISEIKAQWLELAPELVEARHRFLPHREEREATLNGILTGISQKPMRRPALVDRVLNTVHFTRHARIKVS
ncbi:hypothetical protein DDZ13_11595 [Coraliomargarita sinensis]|uniref:Uncharacterized protein n=1 Tax=Coraliomargarita sinensis TaxID=2174842 RepID=A0A317ZGX9_9BACT|nr:hypothetical protein [Coraliomargarita sinensis]PXA03617.1 hypothetical protein DDZ13_11595 [Coraliomargarita sinensis]